MRTTRARQLKCTFESRSLPLCPCVDECTHICPPRVRACNLATIETASCRMETSNWTWSCPTECMQRRSPPAAMRQQLESPQASSCMCGTRFDGRTPLCVYQIARAVHAQCSGLVALLSTHRAVSFWMCGSVVVVVFLRGKTTVAVCRGGRAPWIETHLHTMFNNLLCNVSGPGIVCAPPQFDRTARLVRYTAATHPSARSLE